MKPGGWEHSSYDYNCQDETVLNKLQLNTLWNMNHISIPFYSRYLHPTCCYPTLLHNTCHCTHLGERDICHWFLPSCFHNVQVFGWGKTKSAYLSEKVQVLIVWVIKRIGSFHLVEKILHVIVSVKWKDIWEAISMTISMSAGGPGC